MSNYYYYPLCTKDFTFENIFASESISPYKFYLQRGFGIDYFYRLPELHHDEVIVLFRQPPSYNTGVHNDSLIKFILEVDVESLEQDRIIKVSDEIIAYPKTIYLNRRNFNILFFSDAERKFTCLRSEASLPTKSVKKYIGNFKIINSELCKDFTLPTFEFPFLENSIHLRDIEFDRKYNNFKGFVYGIAAGLLSRKSKEEVALKRSFQSITNCFAEFKNRIEDAPKITSSKSVKYVTQKQISIDVFREKLIDEIDASERLYFSLFPSEEISPEKLAIYVLSANKGILRSYEEAMSYIIYKMMDEEYEGPNVYSLIKARYMAQKGEKGVSTIYESMRSIGKGYGNKLTSTYFNDSERTDRRMNEAFREELFRLANLCEDKFANKLKSTTIDLESIFWNVESGEMGIRAGFENLTVEELNEFHIVVSSICNNPRLGKNEKRKEQILSIVEDIGNKTGKAGSGKQTRLYKYLNNEINSYTIDQSSSVIMKNFVAFILNYDSLENLENYVEIKDIEKKWISNAFWCVFNGFSNTSRNFVNLIFDSDDVELQDKVDDYLSKNLKKLVESIRISEKEQGRQSDKNDTPVEKKTEDLIFERQKIFYSQYVEEKYNVPLDSFVSIFKLRNADDIAGRLKSDHKVLKKDAKKLIDQFAEFMSSETLF